VVQHVVDEAKAAGIEHFIFVTGRNKAVIEDHFDIAYELNDTLESRGKTKELEILARDQPQAGQTSFTRQQAPLGLGHAVWCAREIVGDEPFAVLLPDMLSRGSMEQMIAAYEQHGGNIIAVEEVPEDQTHQYGIVSVGEEFGQTFEITGMVEKPKGHRAVELHHLGPLHPAARDLRHPLHQEKGAGGEIQLTDAMIRLMKDQKFFGMKYQGRPTTPARRSASSWPTWPMRWSARTSVPPSARSSRRSCARSRGEASPKGSRHGPSSAC
jgi:UTP--glucose-1-phosphate uridylyltransferase